MAFFNVIIPAFNAEKTIERAIKSVEMQTFNDYELIVIDDCSTDNTVDILEKLSEQYSNMTILLPKKKLFNGGTRNLGLKYSNDCEYLLFLDSDDEFIDRNLFQNIHDFILAKKMPDMVRLPYERYYDESKTGHSRAILMNEERDSSIATVACSPRVACWTKAVRKDLFVPFPENTLFEDVIQHLCQCDVVERVVWFSRPVVRWHLHSKSTSHSNSPKWQSSAWRFVADLMDLNLKHDYCNRRRIQKMRNTQKGLLQGIAVQ